jgi:flagellar biosynthesis/type III secretory pathway protein FliH
MTKKTNASTNNAAPHPRSTPTASKTPPLTATLGKEDSLDQDSPWKDIIEHNFIDFMKFFFPPVSTKIDWKRGYEFLDKELQKLMRNAVDKRRYVDKLVKVWEVDTQQPAWILLHIEVQGQHESNFAQRMYTYQYRLFDRYQHRIASFVIFTDENRQWQPDRFQYQLLGSELIWRYSSIKLLNYQEQWEKLTQDNNPFALVVMAHLQTLQTRKDNNRRFQWKLQLVKLLYERGYSEKQALDLFCFIDWLMLLPPELEDQLTIEIQKTEGKQNMPFISPFEQRALARGRDQGRLEGRAEGRAEGKAEGRAEGKAEGRAEGKAEGRAEGKAEGRAEGKAEGKVEGKMEGLLEGKLMLLLHLAQRKFGMLGESLQLQISALSPDKLDQLSDALLDFNQLSDLEAWLKRQVN